MKKKIDSPNSHGPKRVAIYTRVSSDEQLAKGLSIEMQPDLIRRGLDAKYKPGNYIVVAVLSDPGRSGSLGPTVFQGGSTGRSIRPGLAEVFRLINAHEVDVVAVQDVSRLYRRSGAMLGFVAEMLIPNGVDLFSAAENVDIHTPHGRLQIEVLAATADYQRSSGNEKVASVLNQRRRDGLWQGSAPYGWRFATAAEVEAGGPRTIVPIPEQLVGVARAAKLYLDGHSLRQVAKKLNEEGIPWVRNHLKENHQNEPWTDTRVKLVLRCPGQAGFVRSPEGGLIVGVHAPGAAISAEQFHEIQKAMDQRRTRFRGVRVTKPQFALSGIPVCGVCGGKLMAKCAPGGEYAYICPARRLAPEGEHPPVWARTRFMEQLVVSEVGRLAASPKVLEEARGLVHARAAENSTADQAEASRVNAQLERLTDKKDKLTEKVVNGVVADDEYKSLMDKLRAQESDLQERLQALETSLAGASDRAATLRKALDALGSFPVCWGHLEPCEKAELLRTTIESLAVGVDDAGNFVCLKIRNFDTVTRRLPKGNAGTMHRGSGPDSLTYAELAVLYLFACGKKASEIAAMTNRTKSTISTICARILERLDVPDMKRAVKVAGKLAVKFSETYDLELLRKLRRAPKDALTAMEQMALDLEAEGNTPLEMAKLGITEERIEQLLASARAKLARQREARDERSK